jgi:hypothetical protein
MSAVPPIASKSCAPQRKTPSACTLADMAAWSTDKRQVMRDGTRPGSTRCANILANPLSVGGASSMTTHLPVQKRSPPEVRNSLWIRGQAARVPRPLCKFGIEKDVERSDLAIANNDNIQSGVVWGFAFRA